jgi:colanic acid/amylovoran biosynthesis glycosyltransferase
MNFKAVMIGEGELKQQLELQIESLKLTSIIELAGAKTQNQIRQYMHRANLFVLPGITDNGRAEAQGLVIQEAQSMQLPVLVSDAGGMQEGMQDGITGFVIKEGDIKGFADKIIFLVQDQQLRRRMGEKGSIYVESFFDTRLLTEKLIKLYKRL